MVSSVRALQRLFRTWFTPHTTRPFKRRPTGVRFWVEVLEDRLAPAALSDGGTAVLSISLGGGENIAISSSGTSYTLSSNQTFTAAAAADPANQGAGIFGVGSTTLTVTGAALSQYTKISITDSGPGATVTFADSGGSSYATSFAVTLSNAAAGAISFNGASNFGTFSLQASSPLAMIIHSGGSVTSTTGSLTFQGNQLQLDGTIHTGTGKVTLLAQKDGTAINLGADDAAGSVGLTAAELGRVTTGTLQIGNAQAGAITLSAAIALPTATNVTLASGSDIIFNAGSLNTGGALIMSSGPAGSVQPLTSGVDVNATPGGVRFAAGSNLATTIVGTVTDDDYGQLNVVGDVNLTGTNLVLGGGFAVAAEESFTIVNNAGTNPVVGTFNGLAQGAIIPHFLGSPLSAVVSYVGGDGNDVVLTAKHATTTAVATSASSQTYGQAVTFTVTVSTDTISPTGSVELFDDTTGADLGAGVFQGNGATSTTWTLTTSATQLHVTTNPHAIRAVFTSGTANTLGGSGTLTGGQTIVPLALTASGITANDKVYNATTAATLNTGSAVLSAVLPGDVVTLNTSGATGTFATKDKGNGITVTVSGLTLGGAQGGDYAVTPPTTTANITPATLTVTGITADKVYDATTPATLNTGSAALVGVFTGDTVTLNSAGATSTFASKNVGNAISVTVSGLALAGAQADDYTLTQPALTANITAAPLSVTGISANDKVYDASAQATLNTASATLAGTVYAGDTVTLDKSSATGTFATKNAGNGIAVNIAGLTLSGAQAGNYALTQPGTTANITRANLTVTGVTATDKVYDATTLATVNTSAAALAGVSAGDVVTLTTVGATGTFATKNVATGIAVAVSGLALAGAQASNYSLTQPTTTANITPAPLTVTGVTAANKAYDSTTAATLNTSSGALVGVFAGDTVTLDTTSALGTFASKDVGAGITVLVAGLTLDGAGAGDYTLAQPSLTADITPAALSVTGVSAADKVYDGTVAATLNSSGAGLAGVFAGDGVSLNSAGATGTFASKDVGAGIAVTVAGLKLDGAQAGDYTLTQPTTTANITPAPLTVTGVAAVDKVYDATTAATLNTSGAALAGVFAGDVVTLDATGATGAFASKDVGSGIAVAVAGLTLAGPQAGDYQLTQPTTTANIIPLALTVTGTTASDKTYDATTAATLNTSGAALVGVLAGDTVTLSATGATGEFASKDVGSGITVAVAGLTLAGPQAADYVLTQPTTTANITPRSLTVTGITAADKVYDATTTATLNMGGAALLGVLAGDVVTLDASGASGTFASKDVGTDITVTVAGLTIGGAQAGDYALAQPTTTANITPAALTPLTVTGITAKDKAYDATKTAALDTSGATLVGVFTGDAVTLDASGATGTFASKDVGSDITVTVSGLTLTGAQAANYTLTQPTTTANITPAALTVTGVVAADKVYDATTAATLNTTGAVLAGVFAGDAVTLDTTAAAGAFAGKDVRSAIAVTVSGLTLGGAQAADYTLIQPSPTANITPAPLTVTNVSAADKVYDSTTAATVHAGSAALVGVIAGDSVTLSAAGATGTFASKDVGSDIAVTVSGLALGGTQASDYALTQPIATANITPATLTVTGITAADKVYDATNAATLNTSAAALAGVFAGDAVNLDTTGATATFASKDVGTGIAVNVAGLTLGGTQAGDYTLSQPAATANITPATLTITAAPNTKTFDGNTSAAAVPTVTGLQGSDTVTGLREAYNDATPGNSKILLVTGFTINDGNSGFNYAVAIIPSAAGVITPAAAVTHFAIGAPTAATAGGSFIITITAQDGAGATVTGYSGTVHFSSTDPQASLPADATITGGFGFFLATLKTAASQTITATDTGTAAIAGTSSPIAVHAASAAGFVFTSQPSTATTGAPFDTTLTALDTFGNVATDYSGLVHFTSSDAHASLPADAALTSGLGTFSVTFLTAGSQTVTATDTLATLPTLTGTTSPITTRGLTVTSFTPTPTGFTATFSKPFLPADLTLYGTGLHTVKDVSLVGASIGPINGSLIIDPSNMSLTFKATANSLSLLNDFNSVVLPDDTYTVKLVSGSGTNGFLDALGAGLDGAGNAGHADYMATFTTTYQTALTPVLSIPDFARGPDSAHAVAVPNDSGHGIPITFHNAVDVTEVTFTLSYDPSLLSIGGGLAGPLSDATDPTGSFTLVGSPVISDPTHATASFQFSTATPQSGTVVLGDILAAVPDAAGSVYKAKQLLQLSDIVINGGAVTGAVSASGVHLNAYFGDVTANGRIDGLDVATASEVAQGKDTGFAAYPLLDPAIVGDLALDYSVDAGAVSDLASYTVQLPVRVLPPIPTGLTITPVGADPTLSLGAASVVRGGNGNPSSVSVPVLLDQPHPEGSTGMTEAVLALRYDPAILSVSPGDITLGSLAAGWRLTTTLDKATGQIGIVLYSTTPMAANEAANLVNIAFRVVPGAAVPSTAVQLVNAVTLNGQYYATQVDDAQGQLVLSPGRDRLVIQTSQPRTDRKIGAKRIAALDALFARLANER